MTTKFFYREVVNLTVGEGYLLKGKGTGIIRRIETKDCRILSMPGATARRSTVLQMFVQLENGWLERCCPEPLPAKIQVTDLAYSRGVWLRHVVEECNEGNVSVA